MRRSAGQANPQPCPYAPCGSRCSRVVLAVGRRRSRSSSRTRCVPSLFELCETRRAAVRSVCTRVAVDLPQDSLRRPARRAIRRSGSPRSARAVRHPRARIGARFRLQPPPEVIDEPGSLRASPGGSTAFSRHCSSRCVFVNVPSFSAWPAAGKRKTSVSMSLGSQLAALALPASRARTSRSRSRPGRARRAISASPAPSAPAARSARRPPGSGP